MYQGQLILAQGAALNTLSTTFIQSLQTGQVYQPVTNAINASIGQKLEAVADTQTESSANSIATLKAIHQELVKANDKNAQPMTLHAEIALDGESTSAFLGGQYVKNTSKYARATADATAAAVQSNYARKTIGQTVNGGDV
jgi:hypothetical protein